MIPPCFPLYVGPIRIGSPPSASGRPEARTSVTCKNERRRTVLDEPRNLYFCQGGGRGFESVVRSHFRGADLRFCLLRLSRLLRYCP